MISKDKMFIAMLLLIIFAGVYYGVSDVMSDKKYQFSFVLYCFKIFCVVPLLSPTLCNCRAPLAAAGERSPGRLAAPAASSSPAIREGVRVPDIFQHCIDCLCTPCYVFRKYCCNERSVIS